MKFQKNQQNCAVELSPELTQEWVLASRRLSQLQGYMQATPLAEVWSHVLVFVEALDSSHASGVKVDAAVMARHAVMRESSCSAEVKAALRGWVAMKAAVSWPIQTSVSVADLAELHNLLHQGRSGVKSDMTSDVLTDWLNDWQLATQTGALPDVLLQWPLLHARWQQLQPMRVESGRLGRLLDVMLFKRAGLLPSVALLWSRSLMDSEKDLAWLLDRQDQSEEVTQALQILMLKALASAASATLDLLNRLNVLWSEVHHAVQAQHKFFSHELIVHLFKHPATRVELLTHDLAVTRLTATRYLDALVDTGILQRERHGRDNIFSHGALKRLLLRNPDRFE